MGFASILLLGLEPITADAYAYDSHAITLDDEIKYPDGFQHFDYVNIDAPQGGSVRLSVIGSFDSLTPLIPRGLKAAGSNLTNQQLLTSSFDEPNTQYASIAERILHPDDFSSVTFRLNPNARWHDGKPISVDDVIYSYQKAAELSPVQRSFYHNVESVRQSGPREVTFEFDISGNRELPYIMGQLTIIPKHWWEGVDANGKRRDISKTTLEPTLGSGAYRIESVDPGRSISYVRVPDAWANNLPSERGKNNFERIVYEYYRSPTAALESFKAGKIDIRFENTAKTWATGYDFSAVKTGEVRRDIIPLHSYGIMQSWTFNLRLDKFKDARVRRAFNLAFNFEDFNKALFYGQYERINSYYFGTEMASSGLPSDEELALLTPLRGKIPEEVFTTVYRNPINLTRSDHRKHLRQAAALLTEAGWKVRNGVRQNSKGEALEVEVLVSSDVWVPHTLRYAKQLRPLGIVLKPRVVDPTQYVNRVRQRDFEIVVAAWGQSLSPGNEQRTYWSSKAATQPNSRNYSGISDKNIDTLIDKVILAGSRKELISAVRALDRVLLANHFVVPMWTMQATRIARWDHFDHVAPLPRYSVGFPEIWWRKDLK